MGIKVSFGSIAVGLIVSSIAAAAPPETTKDAAANPATKQTTPPAVKQQPKPRVKVKISKETTYITEPLRPDGYPDYVAALDQRFSAGVTPENNSAVLFWRALGPKEISEKHRAKYFEMLGIEPLPEQGAYFVDIADYVIQKKKAANPTKSAEDISHETSNEEGQVYSRPWSKEEFPLFAEALATNEKQLAILVEASKRPRRYDPLLGNGSVIAVLLPGPQGHRSVVRALVARAMLRIQEGKVDEAREDLTACHRFAQLLGQGPTLVEALVAITIDGIAFTGDRALAEHGKLTSQQLLQMRDDLEKLPSLPKMADLIDFGERLVYLDTALLCARGGLTGILRLTSDSPSIRDRGLAESLIEAAASGLIDWNIVLRTGHPWYDRLVTVMREPNRTARRDGLACFNKDVKSLAVSIKDYKSFGVAFLFNPQKAASEATGNLLTALLVPAYTACAGAEDRWAMNLDLTKLAFSLAAYRVDHGSYPEKLSELAPKYAKAVPKDVFNDADLHYRRHDGGYLLYSVGLNGKDDGGRDIDDRKEGDTEFYDDLVVRVPGKK